MFTNTQAIRIYASGFHGNGMTNRAIDSRSSNVTLVGCVFERNKNEKGGAISAMYGYLTLIGCAFTDNYAELDGGAIYLWETAMFLRGLPSQRNNFTQNLCLGTGGAVYCINCVIDVEGYNHFNNNSALGFSGGAFFVVKGVINFRSIGSTTFSHNKATFSGGALFLMHSSSGTFAAGSVVAFVGNSARDGASGIHSTASELVLDSDSLLFRNNIGTAVVIINHDTTRLLVISGNFEGNFGRCGGVSIDSRSTTTLNRVSFVNNTDSAICALNSRLLFSGVAKFISNSGRLGGAINSRNSILESRDAIEFAYNEAVRGGAIYSQAGVITFAENTMFLGNTANTDGGALYATGTIIFFRNLTSVFFNSAKRGGAMFLTTTTTLTLGEYTTLNTSHNHASIDGGVIFFEDLALPLQCNFDEKSGAFENRNRIAELPQCFLQSKGVLDMTFGEYHITVAIYTLNDTAGRKANFIHGGLLDRCRFDISALAEIRTNNIEPLAVLPYGILTQQLIQAHDVNASSVISSSPYKLCFCEGIDRYNCSSTEKLVVCRGQTFILHLLAMSVHDTPTETFVSAGVKKSARLDLNQSSQFLHSKCSPLTFSLYSAQYYEELLLFPEGPCRDTGLAKAVVHVSLRPCPDGFMQSGEQCICEERLQAYDAQCTIDSNIYVTRGNGPEFWVSTLYSNLTYQGLILHKNCPADYCKKGPIDFFFGRTRQPVCQQPQWDAVWHLCRKLQPRVRQFSMQRMSKHLLIFASCFCCCWNSSCCLSVLIEATAVINSVVLYANIVQVSKESYFANVRSSVLTVFIAWMNLDLGVETCFYDGMKAYEQTLLQFAFPIYVWILISLIVLVSRYSITASKLVGHNPIAVLATLLLMSYTKMLKIIVDVYNFANLDYPGGREVVVWRKDATIPYMQSQHLILMVVTSTMLVFLFIPYTIFLSVGHKLYRFSNRKHFRWFNKLKPLLDSYYAPYKPHTRYWTGFMLLIRCLLYAVIALTSTNMSHLVIIIAFTAVIIIAWLSVRVYKTTFANVVEASVYLNLVTLSAASATHTNSAGLVSSLIGIVFATMLGISAYHFHLQVTIKSEAWARIKCIIERLKILAIKNPASAPVSTAFTRNSSNDEHRIVSKTVIDLREPLLDAGI
jgi:predicted outer membrane repeat protein